MDPDPTATNCMSMGCFNFTKSLGKGIDTASRYKKDLSNKQISDMKRYEEYSDSTVPHFAQHISFIEDL